MVRARTPITSTSVPRGFHTLFISDLLLPFACGASIWITSLRIMHDVSRNTKPKLIAAELACNPADSVPSSQGGCPPETLRLGREIVRIAAENEHPSLKILGRGIQPGQRKRAPGFAKGI